MANKTNALQEEIDKANKILKPVSGHSQYMLSKNPNPSELPTDLPSTDKVAKKPIQAQNKPQRKPLSNKDKLFLKNLEKHKYNQTKAYIDTYPDSNSYKVSNSHAVRKVRQLEVNGSLDRVKDLSLEITDRYLSKESEPLKERAKIASPIVTKQYTEKIDQKVTDITPKEEDDIHKRLTGIELEHKN